MVSNIDGIGGRFGLIRFSIKKAEIPGRPLVFAVKFIHKDYAFRNGRVTPKQLDMEITLHKHLGRHANIVEFYQAGDDATWRWIAMELAEGGDLFDKIESDVGVGEDIAHLYFRQLIDAVAFMHGKGVGHRDIKPENMLLSVEGELKIADFGLATLFSHNGQRKTSKTSCGSPPYTAPEVVKCNALTAKQGLGYYGDQVDIWSCGVVLFVLLVGNTPWDEPTDNSYEFHEYAKSTGRPADDELWHKLPDGVVWLLRGMMDIDSSKRFSLQDVQSHQWYNRSNPHLGEHGKAANPVALATEMFETMHIDFSQEPRASQRTATAIGPSQDAMDVDGDPELEVSDGLKTPQAELSFDFDTAPPSSRLPPHYLKSQPISSSFEDRFAEDPICSQFAPQPAVPLSRTQFAQRFNDILPSESMSRFLSTWSIETLLPHLMNALQELGIPVAPNPDESTNGFAGYSIKVRTKDSRKCLLTGEVILERFGGDGEPEGCQVCFIKTKGDNLQWRRLFKNVVLLCQDAVFKPE
jgi:serine/threonine-protein kinase CHEK1